MIDIHDIYIRDPYLLFYQGKYYLYGTTDEQAWKGRASGFKAFVSTDLVNFEEHTIFKNTDDFWGFEQFWAPEVYYLNDKFYLIAAFSEGDEVRRIQILTAENPLGPFIPKKEKLFKDKFSHLDGTLVMDGGKKYIVFSQEWTGLEDRDGRMCIVEVNDDLEPVSDYKVLFKASEAAWTVKEKNDHYVTDGPFVVKNDLGQFVMIWSSFSKSGYSVGQCIADRVDGPYQHKSDLLISENGGHGMIFRKDGKLFLLFHKPNEPHLQERPCFVEIYFDKGILKRRR